MRKKVGVSVVSRNKDEKDKYARIGKSLEELKIASIREMTSKFKSSLTEFASKHKDRINSDPEFRSQFHKMCISVGVDPLASNKGFWADILGVGDFYFEIAVKIIQISVSTRSSNGGIMSLTELVQRLNAVHHDINNQKKDKSNQPQPQRRHQQQLIASEDVIRAIDKISILGNGYRLLKLGGKMMILSVPMEINNDIESLMTIAQSFLGMVSASLLTREGGPYNWSTERFTLAVQPLLSDGIVWIDRDSGETGGQAVSYWFPSIWKECNLLNECNDQQDKTVASKDKA
jgi:ESCRT-II complex subunit VPS22